MVSQNRFTELIFTGHALTHTRGARRDGKGETFLSRITPAVKCVLIDFNKSARKQNTAKKTLKINRQKKNPKRIYN
jgi:hypothetical protein